MDDSKIIAAVSAWLLEKDAVKAFVDKHEPEILSHVKLVVNTVSMEEALDENSDEPDQNQWWHPKLETSWQ